MSFGYEEPGAQGRVTPGPPQSGVPSRSTTASSSSSSSRRGVKRTLKKQDSNIVRHAPARNLMDEFDRRADAGLQSDRAAATTRKRRGRRPCSLVAQRMDIACLQSACAHRRAPELGEWTITVLYFGK